MEVRQRTALARSRQLRLGLFVLLVAGAAASFSPLAAQQEPVERVVRGLDFDGNHALDSYTLAAAIVTTNSSWFARTWWTRWLGLGEKRYFDETEFRRDVVRLILLYRQSGYMRAQVDTAVRRTARDVWVTFRITEGPPVRVTHLDITGVAGILDTAALRADLPLQVGAPFDRFLFQASADTVAARLRNRGYPDAQVLRNFDSNADSLVATVEFDVDPGPFARFGRVEVEGLERVDTATVLRAIDIHRGDVFRQDALYDAQRALYELGLFSQAGVERADSATAGAADTVVDVRVRVAEGPRHRVGIGLGYGTVDCVRAQAAWTALDFLGGGRSLDITGRLSKLGVGVPTDIGLRKNLCQALRTDFTSDTLNYSLGVTLSQPAFLSSRHTASVALTAERRSEINAYVRQDVGANAVVTLNARRNWPLSLGYGFSVGRTVADPAVYCRDFRVCDQADQAFLANRRRFAALTATAVRDRTNSVLDPTDGSLFSVGVMHASRLVGSDPFYEFNRGEFGWARYIPLSRTAVFAWRIRAGAILPQRITLSGQSARFVPPEQRFYAGGPNSVRGYGRNELGPRVYVTDTLVVTNGGADTSFVPSRIQTAPTGGNAVFVANAELRVATPFLPERMRLAVFVDAGQVWERGDPLAVVHGIRITPGVGLRLTTPLGPVRLDAAYNGYGQEPGALYVQSGNTLTLVRSSYQPPRPTSFGSRITLQFAVGEAF